MFLKLKILLLGVAFAGATACTAKVTSNNPPPAPSQPAALQAIPLAIGKPGAPAQNEISVPAALPSGGSASFTWTQKEDGVISITTASEVWIGCKESPFKREMTLRSSNDPDFVFTPPARLELKAARDYALVLEMLPNDCMSATYGFQVVEETVLPPGGPLPPPQAEPPVPTPNPVPQPPKRPTVLPGEGFVKEAELSMDGGSIYLPEVKQTSAYADFYVETTTAKRVSLNARGGSSPCQPQRLLELLEIALDGSISRRAPVDYSSSAELYPGKFYRLRWTLSNLGDCRYVSESFQVRWRAF